MNVQVAETVRTFLDNVQSGPKVVGATLAVLVSAIWYAFTSVLAWALAVLFVVDLSLGILRAVHRGGLEAFDWVRFGRAFIKLGAAFLGIILFVIGDVLFQELGIPTEWYPLTTAAMLGMCFGFFWSGLQNFGYFYPNVREQIERVITKISGHEPEDMRRRSSDSPNKEETSG